MFDEIQSIRNAKFHLKDHIDMLTVGLDGQRIDPTVVWAHVNHHDHEITELRQIVYQLKFSVEGSRRERLKH